LDRFYTWLAQIARMYITPFVSDPFAKESSMIRRCARGIPQPVARLCDFAAPAVC
jgi:hypothetical protein